MGFLFNRGLKIVFTVLYVLAEIATIFIGEIITFSAESGASIHWQALLTNKAFWVFLVIIVAYHVVAIVYDKIADDYDDAIERKLDSYQLRYFTKARKLVEKGKYDESGQVLDSLTKFNEQRQKFTVVRGAHKKEPVKKNNHHSKKGRRRK